MSQSSSNSTPGIRAWKLLNRWGYGTQDEIEDWFSDGRVEIAGVASPAFNTRVPRTGEGVLLDGKPVSRKGADSRLLAIVTQWRKTGVSDEDIVVRLEARGLHQKRARKLVQSASTGRAVRLEQPLSTSPHGLETMGRESALSPREGGRPKKASSKKKKKKASQRQAAVERQAAVDELTALLSMGHGLEEIQSLMGSRFPKDASGMTTPRPRRSKFFQDADTAVSGRHGFPDDLPSREDLDSMLDEVSAMFSIRRGALERRLPKGWIDMRLDDLRVHLEALARQSKGSQKTATRDELLAVMHRVAARTGVPVGTIQCKMPKGWLKMSPEELDAVMTAVAREAGGNASIHEVPVTPASRPAPPPTRRRLTQRQALEEAAQLLASGYSAEEVRTHLGSDAPLLGDRLSLDELRKLEADLHSSGSSDRKGRRVIRRRRAVSASASAPSNTGARSSEVERSPAVSDGPRTSGASAHALQEPVERSTTADELPDLPPSWDNL